MKKIRLSDYLKDNKILKCKLHGIFYVGICPICNDKNYNKGVGKDASIEIL